MLSLVIISGGLGQERRINFFLNLLLHLLLYFWLRLWARLGCCRGLLGGCLSSGCLGRCRFDRCGFRFHHRCVRCESLLYQFICCFSRHTWPGTNAGASKSKSSSEDIVLGQDSQSVVRGVMTLGTTLASGVKGKESMVVGKPEQTVYNPDDFGSGNKFLGNTSESGETEPFTGSASPRPP